MIGFFYPIKTFDGRIETQMDQNWKGIQKFLTKHLEEVNQENQNLKIFIADLEKEKIEMEETIQQINQRNFELYNGLLDLKNDYLQKIDSSKENLLYQQKLGEYERFLATMQRVWKIILT